MNSGGPPRRYFDGERPPPEPFAEHVLALWTFDVDIPEGESALHTMWPDGCVSLSIVANHGVPAAASIVGPRLRALRAPVHGGLVLRGLRLWPDTAASVLGVNPAAIRDLTRPATEVLGFGALSLARALACASDDAELDAVWATWLEPRIARAALPDPDVRFVVRRLIDSDGTGNIAATAREAGISARSLDRRFSAAVGLSPKQFARVRRVRAAIGSIAAGERSVTTLARNARLAPASFTREFRSVADVAPLALMNELDQLEHSDRTGISAS
ncbi:MAG: helix-turn-helix domain-containing protein [Gemmatimonadaceae bacterium]